MLTDSMTNENAGSTSLPADVTYDSCTDHFVEVVPLTRDTDGPCTTDYDSGDQSNGVRQENLPVVKLELDDHDVVRLEDTVTNFATVSQPAEYQYIHGRDYYIQNVQEMDIKDEVSATNADSGSNMCTSHSTTQFSNCNDNVLLDNLRVCNNDTTEHIKETHTGEMPFTCYVCEKRFKHLHALKRHASIHVCQRTSTDGEGRCSCVCCKKFMFSSPLKTRMHAHTGEHALVCSVCKKHFSQLSNLNVHMRSHNGERPYSCELCKMQFRYNGGLNRHMLTHIGKRRFSCEVCEMQFLDCTALKQHMYTHTGERPFECYICKVGFAQSGTLKRHVRIHTGERPFQCDDCKKGFADSGSLKRHMRTHTGERPFECDFCQRRFSSSSTLTTHKRTHNGERPYTCAICQRSFVHADSLKCHMFSHTDCKPQ